MSKKPTVDFNRWSADPSVPTAETAEPPADTVRAGSPAAPKLMSVSIRLSRSDLKRVREYVWDQRTSINEFVIRLISEEFVSHGLQPLSGSGKRSSGRHPRSGTSGRRKDVQPSDPAENNTP